MKVVNSYSFKGGEEFIRENHLEELKDVLDAIAKTDAIACLSKESDERTMKGKLLLSPRDLNDSLKLILHQSGWTKKASGKRKKFAEPRHNFGNGRFREMDGIKNKVGLEIQFGKYAFMGYDIFSKMIVFKNLGYIECGIEIVPGREMVRQMSTGVSSFDQLLVDFKHRGESDIDIPVLIIGIGLTSEENKSTAELQELFKTNRQDALKIIKLREYSGSPPGPK